MKAEKLMCSGSLVIAVLAYSCGGKNTPDRETVIKDSLTAVHYEIYKGVDKVSVYSDDFTDTVSKPVLIYDTAWGNTPDSVKPKFDLNFFSEKFKTPSFFPAKEALRGPIGQHVIFTDDMNLEAIARTTRTLSYDFEGKLYSYSLVGPNQSFTYAYDYDSKKNIIGIVRTERIRMTPLEPEKKQDDHGPVESIKIIYNTYGSIETLEISGSGKSIHKKLECEYTYVAAPRPHS